MNYAKTTFIYTIVFILLFALPLFAQEQEGKLYTNFILQSKKLDHRV